MESGDLRRWKVPWTMPPFSGVDVFLILRVGDYSVDYIVNGELVRGWRYDYILDNSDPIDEDR